MAPKDFDSTSKIYQYLMETGLDVKNVHDQILKEIARLNDIKPIHFKNPEKLNGMVKHNGKVLLEVTFIGRDLSLKEDNWTWLVKEADTNFEHSLTILKYPKKNGYATMIKNSYGQKTEEEIIRSNLNNMDFMIDKMYSLTDLPF